jgi:iron-sulfur cluster repair protein YtfE (RIC family)
MTQSSSQTVRQILRQRPMAVEEFENLSGPLFWDRMETPLGEFCRDIGADDLALLSRIAQLPVPPADTDWNAKPIHWLVDHLTLDHADFRGRDMPAIEALLVEERLPAYPDGYVVKLLLQEFRHFEADFLKHMGEEEEFLFPKILRNEACFRHRELGPEIHRGSVNLYLRLETHKPEEEFKRMIVSIREKLRHQHLQRPTEEIARRTQEALDGFAARLLTHADLESTVLFPRAGRLEQELYAGAAPGLSRYPGDDR